MVITNGTHCVYVHINKVNGKIYVGKTIHGDHPITRWRSDGSGYKECSYFWKAIQKYGWSNFEHEVVANHLTKEEAFQAYLDAERDFYSDLIKPKTQEDFCSLFKELHNAFTYH